MLEQFHTVAPWIDVFPIVILIALVPNLCQKTDLRCITPKIIVQYSYAMDIAGASTMKRAEDLSISMDMLFQIDKTSALTCRRQVNLQSGPHELGSVLGLTMYSQYTRPIGDIIQSHGILFHFLLMIARYISKQIQTTLNNG